jgi:hypothetical protein
MREGARRDGEKLLGIDPDICLNALRIPVQLAHPDVWCASTRTLTVCRRWWIRRTGNLSWGSSFKSWVRCLRRQRTAPCRHRTREGAVFWTARGSREV